MSNAWPAADTWQLWSFQIICHTVSMSMKLLRNAIRPGKHELTVIAFQHLPHCLCGLRLPSTGLWSADVLVYPIMTDIPDSMLTFL